MLGKIITRKWTARGPKGKKVERQAHGYDLALPNGERERRFCKVWLSKGEAQTALEARRREVSAGKITRPEQRTLGQLAEEYLDYKRDHGKRSLHEDERILTKQLLPAFGADLPVRQLTGPLIAQFEKRRAGEVSVSTVANELTVLRHLLRLGRRWGYLADAPDIDMPKKRAGRQRYLDTGEIRRLLDACDQAKSKSPHLRPIVTIALNTGMRRGEILGLAWERVDLATSRITLYETKGGKRRGVPLNRAVYETLIALEPDGAQRVGRLFKRRDGAAWGQIRTAFTNAVVRAGITSFRFHDLRHTCASHLVMNGRSLKEVQEILGHSDFRMTLRYSHLSPAHLRAAVDALDGLTPTAQESAQSPARAEVESLSVV